jgi:hypothetical protein
VLPYSADGVDVYEATRVAIFLFAFALNLWVGHLLRVNPRLSRSGGSGGERERVGDRDRRRDATSWLVFFVVTLLIWVAVGALGAVDL